MRLICLFISFLVINLVSGQQFITLNGRITDAETSQPISFVAISFKNSNIGTVSNTDGYYLFHIPINKGQDTLLVSSIGYEAFSIKVSEAKGKNLDIKLKPKVYSLSEIAVKPKDALEIVKAAIAKIPDNYPQQAINMDGFYQEMTFENDTCVELAEAACVFYYRPYNESVDVSSAYESYYNYSESHYEYFINNIISLPTNPKDQLNIIEGRSSDLMHKNHIKVVPRGGPLSLTAFDIPKTKYLLFKENLINKFNYDLIGIVALENRQVYVISFVDKRRDKFISKGVLYIDVITHAFVRIHLNIILTTQIKYTRYWTPALYAKKRKKCKDLFENYKIENTVDYKKIRGKWYLNRISQKESFDYTFSKHYIHKKTQAGYSYRLQKDLLINKRDTNNVVEQLKEKTFSNSLYSILYEHDLEYNASFWRNYNIIKTTPLQNLIVKQLEVYESIDKQFEEQFVKVDTIETPKASINKIKNPYTGIEDDYYWMQDIKNPKVIEYIAAENQYAENEMLPLKQLRRNLYNEMIGRLAKDTSKVKELVKVGDFIYYYEKLKGKNIENLYRKNTLTEKTELIIDFEKLSNEKDNYFIDNFYVHPNNSYIAFKENYGLDYENTLIIKDISSGKILMEIENVSEVIWKNSENAFYYLVWDKTNRLDKLFYQELGTKNKIPQLVYHESNAQKQLSVWSYDKKWLVVYSEDDLLCNDAFLIKLNIPGVNFKKIVTSKLKHSDNIQIINDTIFSLSNENNYSILYYSSTEKPEKENWVQLLNAKNDNFRSFALLKNYIIINELNNMLPTLKIYSKNGQLLKKNSFNEPSCSISLLLNEEIHNENKFRFKYSSLKTPSITYEYVVKKNERRLIRKLSIKGYNEKDYKTEIIWATSKDGTKIPISVFYNNKRSQINGKSPLYLTAYGSYGNSSLLSFVSEYLSLVDRGFIVGIAHVRGGGELGNKWHEEGMCLKKKNTFYDFIACAEYLIEKKYTSEKQIVIEGGSAGGLVMGAISNMKPDLFNTVILTAPFVDVLGSVMDSTAKFSSLSRGEHGDPNKPEVYNYIESYSPYQNIKAQNYPNLLYYIGLSDDRVEYWQSLKSVAKIRELKTDKNKLLLKTELFAGHSGYNSVNAHYAERGFVYSFILDNLGISY